MKKIFKIGLRILAVLLALIVIVFTGAWVYLKQHKKQVISFIESEAKKGLNGGDVHIGDINIGFNHTFPRIAFTIDTLSLRDSLWFQHHHDLISVTRAYATLDFFKLLIGKINIGRVQLENPHFYIYTDTSGYTNTSVFKKNTPPKNDAPKNLSYPILDIRNGMLIVDKKDKKKFFSFDIPTLICHIEGNTIDPVLEIDGNLNCRVQRMVFNPEKGPFLEGKTVDGEIAIQFNKASKILQFEKIKLSVDGQLFTFTGKFFLGDIPTPFILSWETEHLPFRKATSFLSHNIKLKLDQYDISEPITHLTGSMDNSEPEYKTPLIHLKLNVENATVKTPVVSIANASFTATFNNEEIKGQGHEDENTVMHFTSFTGSLDKFNFHCDSIVIRNLIHPRMNLHILSDFQLGDVNTFLDGSSLAFVNGSGNIDLIYRGSLESNYDSSRTIAGNFNLDSGEINYIPRNLLFTRVNGVVRFTGKDMIIDNLLLNAGSTDLAMDGSVKNLFYLINQRNTKLRLDWSIRSKKLNLNDFTNFLKKKQAVVTSKKKKPAMSETITGLTNLLETADIGLTLNAKQLIYKKFYADNLVANLDMNDNAINLKNIRIQHSGGSIAIQGNLRNEVASNPFSFNAQLKNVNVSKILYGFNSFGMKSLTDKNIGGALTADITLQGGLTTKAEIEQGELKGFVKFNLENGELIQFEPVQKISQTVFKNRDFSDIQFADLHDLLEINGENVTINRMEIHSSVLTMFVEGIYNMRSGPDLSVQVPLSNLKASKDSVLVNKGISSKTGVSAKLRLQRGSDGKIKVSWDPFNKASKKLKKKAKS